MSEKPILEEKLLKDLYEMNFSIPIYQRPYKWKKEHVIRLLDDLYENIYQKKGSMYRIGSLILHEDEKKNPFDIVDGQQRLTTISMILYHLKSENILLKAQDYKHEISKNNIKFNYSIIENWFESKSFSEIELKSFLSKIEDRMQFVIITVYKQDEAFQLFDSQNSRGKPLYPHDLLKAFHLREMEKDGGTEPEIEKYATQWENYILEEDKLMNVLNDYLFRIRNWCKGIKKYTFTKSDLDEFKGISLNKKNEYNYELSSRILDGFTLNSQNDKLLRNFHIPSKFPFQITMPIINGKNFFDYVFHYIELKKDVFEMYEKDQFNNFYHQFCLGDNSKKYENREYNYWGSWRVGDVKVRNVFENICLLFVDRFGINSLSKIYFQEFYKNAYQLRLENKSINENSVLNFHKSQKFFNIIPNKYTPEELHTDLFCNFNGKDKVWIKENYVNGIEPIFEFITNKKTNNGR